MTRIMEQKNSHSVTPANPTPLTEQGTKSNPNEESNPNVHNIKVIKNETKSHSVAPDNNQVIVNKDGQITEFSTGSNLKQAHIKIGQKINLRNNNYIPNNFNGKALSPTVYFNNSLDKIETSDSDLSQLSHIENEGDNNILPIRLDSNLNTSDSNFLMSERNPDSLKKKEKKTILQKRFKEEESLNSENSKVSFGNKIVVVANKNKTNKISTKNSNNGKIKSNNKIKKEKKQKTTDNKVNIKEKRSQFNEEEEEERELHNKKKNNGGRKKKSISLFTDSSNVQIETLKKGLRAKQKKRKQKVEETPSTISSASVSVNTEKVRRTRKRRNKNFDSFFNKGNNFNQLNYPYGIPYLSPIIPVAMPVPMQMQPVQSMNYQYQQNYPYNNSAYPTPTPSMNYQNNYTTQPQDAYLNTPFTPFSKLDSDPNSCTYCEEIYKYTIMNNLPLKIMTCLYCNKQMNGSSLEFYLRKYKDELEEHYKNVILSHENNADKTANNDYSLNTSQQFEYKLQSESGDLTNSNNKKSKDDFDLISNHDKILKDNYMTSSIELNIPVMEKPTKAERLKSVDHIRERDESTNLVLDTTDTGMSLAEIFKQRRTKLFSKLEVRGTSVKENKNRSTTDLSESDNMEIKNIIKHKKKKEMMTPKVNLDLNSIAEEKKTRFNYDCKTEPSSELMDRLIHGKRAVVSDK